MLKFWGNGAMDDEAGFFGGMDMDHSGHGVLGGDAIVRDTDIASASGAFEMDEDPTCVPESIPYGAYKGTGPATSMSYLSTARSCGIFTPDEDGVVPDLVAQSRLHEDIPTNGGLLASSSSSLASSHTTSLPVPPGGFVTPVSTRELAFTEDTVDDILGMDDRGLESAVTTSLVPNLDSASVSELRILAQVTEKAELYEDMRVVVRRMVQVSGSLGEEERHLLATAYKNVIGVRRATWRALWEKSQQEKRQEEAERALATAAEARAQRELKDDPDDPYGDLDKIEVPPFVSESLNSLNGIDIEDAGSACPLEDHGDRTSPLAMASAIVREELEEICLEMIDMVHDSLLPRAEKDHAGADVIIFYQKLIADYYRYLAEHMRERDRKDYVASADHYYSEALDLADKHLPPAHPLLLGLVLNVSVFYFEVLNTPDKACQLAKEKHDAAARYLESTPDADRDASVLLDLLRENLTVWTLSET